jgi:hypothetical protein
VNLAVGVIGVQLVIWLMSQLIMLSLAGRPFGSILTFGALTFGFAIVAILLVLIARRSNRARITFVILAVVSLPGAAIGIVLPSSGTTRPVAVIGLAMTVLGTALLLLPESSTWFTGVRSPRAGVGRDETKPAEQGYRSEADRTA